MLSDHGGTMQKFIGDAVVAVFGVPVVHEDDALRAVTDAARLRGALDGLNAELDRKWSVRLQVRMGDGQLVSGGAGAGGLAGDQFGGEEEAARGEGAVLDGAEE
jgi:class 3 adenylate cyclase